MLHDVEGASPASRSKVGMSRVELLPEAVREIERTHAWNEQQRHGLGLEFLLSLDAVLSRAVIRLDSFPILARRTHRAVLRRFPYQVFYVVEAEHLLIPGVFHGHRDPAHWVDRVQENLQAAPASA